jgi:hypothetical protein
VAIHSLVPLIEKKYQKNKSKKTKIRLLLVLKDKIGGYLLFFCVSCWILADTALLVHHLSSLFLACCHIYSNTFLGQQLGHVLWTLIQHCYLLLTCVPHTYTAFEPSQAPPSPEQNRLLCNYTHSLRIIIPIIVCHHQCW